MDDIWPWLTAGGLRGHAGGSWLSPGALGHSNPPTGFPGPSTAIVARMRHKATARRAHDPVALQHYSMDIL